MEEIVTKTMLDTALADSTGSGIEQVSGTVTLDSTGEPIREFFTVGATTFAANGTDTLISSYTAVVWRRTGAGSWGYQIVPETWTTPAATPDTTAPVAGTLTVDTTGTTATLTVTGASDDRGTVTYAFSKDGGTNYTSPQSDPTYTFTGLTQLTSYTWRHRVSDGTNVTVGASVTKSTTDYVPVGVYDEAILADSPTYYLPLDDAVGSTTARNLGSAGGSVAVTGFTFGATGIGDQATAATTTQTSVSAGIPNSFTTTGCTVEFLVTTAGKPTAEVQVMGFGNPAKMFWYAAGDIKAYWGSIIIGPTLVDGTRYHVAVTYSPTTGSQLFVNGVSKGTASTTGVTGGNLTFGRFIGTMAGLSYIPSVISAGRIAAHAQAAGLA